uniref:Asparaginase n=1 Tax=Panagrolaimus sp. PS1159 TaxID=55785 RepID=A0AC35FJ53_9BILA
MFLFKTFMKKDEMDNFAKVLVLYTGGTIGMKKKNGTYVPAPNEFGNALRNDPTLDDKEFIDAYFGDVKDQPYCLPSHHETKKRIVYWLNEYDPLLDSSDIKLDDWIKIAKDIEKYYNDFDGFVVLHGTDTLAYTASALSFLIDNLSKPVVVSGAQIAIVEEDSDGHDNLIGALLVAGSCNVPEVTVYFDGKLLRANRCVKLDSISTGAFVSPNVDPLAVMDKVIKVNEKEEFKQPENKELSVTDKLCENVTILYMYPFIQTQMVETALQEPVEGVVIKSYGAGNLPSNREDIMDAIKKAVNRGCIVVNTSQCVKGHVHTNYETGKMIHDAGVIFGADMTTETAFVKLSYILGRDDWDLEMKKRMMTKSLKGEVDEREEEEKENEDSAEINEEDKMEQYKPV